MSINALNGLFAAFGGADKLGSRLSDAYSEMRLGAATGAARRAAAAEGLALDNQLIEQDTGRVQLAKPDAVYDRQTARRFRQEEGPAAMVEVPQTEKKRRADVMGDTDVEALYLTKYLPEQVKKLRDAGNANVADHLERYVSTDIGQRQARAYAKFAKSWVGGNYDGVARAMEEYQGLTGAGAAKVTHKGNGTFSMSLIDPGTGKSSEYEFNGDAMMGRMGLAAYMDPMKIAERVAENNKEAAANLAKVTAAKEETRRQLELKGLGFKYDVARDNLKYQQDIAKMIQQNNLDMSKPTDKQRVFEWLEKGGVPRAELDKYISGIVEGRGGGGDGMRQAPNPQDLAKQYISDRLRNDPAFAELPEPEQTRRAVEYVKRLQEATAPLSAPPTAGKAPGAASGLPLIWK